MLGEKGGGVENKYSNGVCFRLAALWTLKIKT